MSERQIKVLPTLAAVAEEGARVFIEAARRCIERADRFTVALSGGSTPKPLYELLASEPFAAQVSWAKVEVYFTDERCVPPGHEQSNYRLAEELLLGVVPIPAGQVYRMRGEIDPQTAARDYGRLLKDRFESGGVDLAILGMGEDAHTASLFPGTAALGEMEHRCVANYVEKLSAWRLTLSPMFLNRSGQTLVLVTGARKSATVQRVLEGEFDPQQVPIQLINPPAGQVTWLLDAEAAGM